MGPENLVFMIPIVAILGGISAGIVGMWLKHKEFVMKMKQEQQERQRQREQDDMTMNMGHNPLFNAHLEAILERLNSLETKLATLDPATPPQASEPRTMNSIPASDETRRSHDENLA